jgi:hypothetical protein
VCWRLASSSLVPFPCALPATFAKQQEKTTLEVLNGVQAISLHKSHTTYTCHKPCFRQPAFGGCGRLLQLQNLYDVLVSCHDAHV